MKIKKSCKIKSSSSFRFLNHSLFVVFVVMLLLLSFFSMFAVSVLAIPPVNPSDPDDDDVDGDGILDTDDICAGDDDNMDMDNDGIPDGCDDTSYGEEPDDDADDEPPADDDINPADDDINPADDDINPAVDEGEDLDDDEDDDEDLVVNDELSSDGGDSIDSISEPDLKELQYILVNLNGVLGRIFDTDGDGIIDIFFNTDSGVVTKLDKESDDFYLIDSEGNGEYDYLYNPLSGELRIIQEQGNTAGSQENNSAQWYLIFLVISLLVAFAAVLSFSIYKDQKRLSANQKQ